MSASKFFGYQANGLRTSLAVIKKAKSFPKNVEIAFEGERLPVPRLDPLASAKLAERAFGASSVLLGRVMRYREREGSAAGSAGSFSSPGTAAIAR